MQRTLGYALERAFGLHRQRVAVEWHGGTLTYGDLEARTAGIASALSELGVTSGDVVALFMTNSPDVLLFDIAIARLGAVKVPVNYLLPAVTVAHIIQDSGAAVLVLTADLAGTARSAFASLDGEISTIVVGGETDIPGAHQLEELVRRASTEAPVSTATADDVAAIFYTGGTTGKPKGVVHTQASVIAFHYAQMIEAEVHDDERMLLMTPLAHAAGLFAQTALLRGATVVLAEGFDPSETLRALREERVSWMFLVPTMLYRMLDLVARDGLEAPALRTIVYGAAPISADRLVQAIEAFGSVFVQLYGQTECPNWGTRLSKRDHDSARPELLGSCGQASTMADVRVVDDDGQELPVGQIGEICLRSPYTLSRYHGNPEATAAKFLGDFIRTGDVGLLDEDGYLFLKDRRADMVISGGMNVYCSEVEEALRQHPAVSDAAVIGIPDVDWGEAVHALVVSSDVELQAQDLLTFVRSRVAGYARPKSVEFIDDLPLTPFGKVDKKALRDPYWGARDRAIN